jgi:predicted porin
VAAATNDATRQPDTAAISARMKAGQSRRFATSLGQNHEMPRMTRTIRIALVAVAASLCSIGAAAQNAVLYGLVDASGSRTKEPGGSYRWQLDNGNLQSSFIGVRGSEDLGGGLRAVFRLESYLRIDTGSSGRTDADPFWAREASVGLSGAFGSTVLGRTATPLYLATINFNPFGESAGFSPSARQYFGSRGAILGDTRWNNSLSYNNNVTDTPLRINVAANVPEEPAGAPSTGHNYGGSIAYVTGPFAVSFAGERIRNSALATPTGFDHQDALQLAATYDFAIVRVYGQLGHVKTHADLDEQTILYQLGFAVPIGNGLVLASYGYSHLKSPGVATTDRTGSLGYDYFLSKNTDIYVAAMLESLTAVSSGASFAGGVRLRF